ncbi:MAG: IclR family transcriptional regulator [Desulfobacteraceae bacterium]|nr:MAG: IclR family transcriptional regulator [Desulfobacteraceae bacterium]
MTKPYQAPIVKKAFDILKAISRSREGLSISDLSKKLDIGKSTVHGIMAALEAQGAIIRDPVSKRFSSGPTLIELGRLTHERIDLKKIARPFLEELMETCEESVFLGIRNGDHATVIDIVESKKDFKITSPIGTSIPILAGAIGKVFLSQLPRSEATAFLEDKSLPRFTTNSITSKTTYLRELQRVRQNGYALDDEEYISGVRAVASPVGGFSEGLAAIWVVGFKAGLRSEKIDQLISLTCDASQKISRKLLK